MKSVLSVPKTKKTRKPRNVAKKGPARTPPRPAGVLAVADEPKADERRRPTKADAPAILDLIVEKGYSLRRACQTLGFDTSSASKMMVSDPELALIYADAKLMRADFMADQAGAVISRLLSKGMKADEARVAVDYYKWTASTLAPKEFGDKQTQELTGPNGQPLNMQASIIVIHGNDRDAPAVPNDA